MDNKDLYVPMNELIMDKETHWTFTTLPATFPRIAEQGIIMWCVDNLEGRWTMLGGNKFGFEDGQDATIFKMQFGYNNA